MNIITNDYAVKYIESEHTITIKGNLRLKSVEKYDEIISYVIQCSMKSNQTLNLDVTQLTVINSSGIASLGLCLIKLRDLKKKVKILASKFIHWQTLSLKDFKEINPDIELEYVIRH